MVHSCQTDCRSSFWLEWPFSWSWASWPSDKTAGAGISSIIDISFADTRNFWRARISLTPPAGAIPAPARASHPPGIEPWTCSGNAAG